MFSARLRLSNSMPMSEKAQRVNSLIQQLGLAECADTRVGDEKVITLPQFRFPHVHKPLEF